jgi:hypothetical protein
MEELSKEWIAFSPFYYRLPDDESGADVYDRVSTSLKLSIVILPSQIFLKMH